MTRIYVLLAMIFGFILAGCGQSGPLYLADDPSEIHDPPQQTEIETEDDEDESRND